MAAINEFGNERNWYQDFLLVLNTYCSQESIIPRTPITNTKNVQDFKTNSENCEFILTLIMINKLAELKLTNNISIVNFIVISFTLKTRKAYKKPVIYRCEAKL